jgi:hypothetical protein
MAQDKEAELATLFEKLDSFAEHGQHAKALKVVEQSERRAAGGACSCATTRWWRSSGRAARRCARLLRANRISPPALIGGHARAAWSCWRPHARGRAP